jgi:glycerol-3-phosphate cytidylyltransferase
MRKGFVCGAFDLLHVGHLILLEKCKDECDYLLVGLHVDPSIERKSKNKPIQSIFERLMQLKSCKYVDGVIIYETEKELEVILRNFGIDIRFLGSDYDGTMLITAEDAVQTKVVERNHNYSSTELIERIKNGRTKNTR